VKIVVTGATGYIGQRLVRHALALGYEVISASRQRSTAQIEWIPFNFSSNAEIALPEGAYAVFHLAATTTSYIVDANLELRAAEHLITATEQAGAKLIYMSSQTANENAPSVYGRTKWQIERLVLAAGGQVVRPGQVYGGTERALFGTLVNIVRRLPVIPAFLPSPKIQPVHVDDLVAALLQCTACKGQQSSILCIGAITPVTFTEFLRRIALVRVRRARLPIPIPVVLIRLAGFAVGRHFRAKLGIDRLMSLFNLPVMDTEGDMKMLGVTLRSLKTGMSRSGDDRHRALIREGQSLLAYVLKTKPTLALVRRYVRCIKHTRQGQPLFLPEFALRLPFAIALLDDAKVSSMPSGAEFVWRLNAAVAFSEATIQGAGRFLAIGESSGFIRGLLHISYAVALELWWRTLKFVVSPLLRSALRKSGFSQ
jgi:uncharacterized protein YbjT (DUF2867 family)